jgi:DNA-binding MarR family transcriptional regulator
MPEHEPDARLVRLVELLFFAYRDFTGEADAILAEIGFGRAHHRVLHFVNRNPGLRVADLLGILKITKQSLARVLKQLVDQGYVVQSTGEHDRRERRLALTEKGASLARRLLALQAQRVAAALAVAGPESDPRVQQFLFAMISGQDRNGVAALLGMQELAR